MPWNAILCGAMLIAIGLNGYFNGTPKEDGSLPMTALIPAYIGGALAVLGALGFVSGLRKHVMHVAAMVGLFGVLGGLMPLIRQASKGEGIDLLAPSVRAGLMMTVICAAFVFLCIQSFIAARKAREAKAAAEKAG
jgi:hypothetical protein